MTGYVEWSVYFVYTLKLKILPESIKKSRGCSPRVAADVSTRGITHIWGSKIEHSMFVQTETNYFSATSLRLVACLFVISLNHQLRASSRLLTAQSYYWWGMQFDRLFPTRSQHSRTSCPNLFDTDSSKLPTAWRPLSARKCRFSSDSVLFSLTCFKCSQTNAQPVLIIKSKPPFLLALYRSWAEMHVCLRF